MHKVPQVFCCFLTKPGDGPEDRGESHRLFKCMGVEVGWDLGSHFPLTPALLSLFYHRFSLNRGCGSFLCQELLSRSSWPLPHSQCKLSRGGGAWGCRLPFPAGAGTPGGHSQPSLTVRCRSCRLLCWQYQSPPKQHLEQLLWSRNAYFCAVSLGKR